MTKKEMIEGILAGVKWSEETKKQRTKMALDRDSKRRIEIIYKSAMGDKENAVYYANLL